MAVRAVNWARLFCLRDEQLRDEIVDMLRSGRTLLDEDREMLADVVKRRWSIDTKRNKRVERRNKELLLRQQYRDARADGMTSEQARNTLPEGERSTEVEGLLKRFRRNCSLQGIMR